MKKSNFVTLLILWVVATAASCFSLFGNEPIAIEQDESQLLEGQVKAICYSGFRKGQHPDRGDGAVNPSEAEILEDLLILSRDGNFSLLRLYDAQTNSRMVLELIKEHDIPCKILLGAWLDAEINNPGCPWLTEPYSDEKLAENKVANLAELERAIQLANEFPDIVVAVAVGNEALVEWNDHMVPVEQVIEYVRKVKAAIVQPVTVADNYDWWAKEGQALAAELDFVSIHIYPVWEGKSIDEGISYGIENVQRVRDTLPDSMLVITEAGWATTASEFGDRANEAAQQRYYEELYEWADAMNITTFFFEAFDESWKGNPDNPIGAEKHWGIFFEDRTPKKVMHALYPDLMR
jgi:exo-beta-1,3-glucanase (GH17 family)